MFQPLALKHVIVTFDKYEGEGEYIVISTGDSWASRSGIYIDDIKIDYIDKCRRIENVNIVDFNDRLVTLKWENITGFRKEPWHYRYVGKEAAKYIHEHNICSSFSFHVFLELFSLFDLLLLKYEVDLTKYKEATLSDLTLDVIEPAPIWER